MSLETLPFGRLREECGYRLRRLLFIVLGWYSVDVYEYLKVLSHGVT